MGGAFQEGDQLHAVYGPGDGVSCVVGYNKVTTIVVNKAAGPMGWYAVAQSYKGDKMANCFALHMMETIVVENPNI